jgi:cell wall-associated NlpC family hydrolase
MRAMKKVVALVVVVTVSFPVMVAAVITGPAATPSPASPLARTEIPTDLLGVYEAAALTCPGLHWQILAGVGWVESRHAGGHADATTGQVNPPIAGPALDGHDGRAALPDPSQPDGWAHALGPMQFLSTTWSRWATLAPDRPPGAMPDLQNAWDAIYSAAAKLCGGQPNVGDIHDALFAYNRSEAYVDAVLAKAGTYGLGASGDSAGGATVSGSGAAVVAAAMSMIGTPYVWGGSSPSTGFDCSGLVQWAYGQIGVSLPRTTFGQVSTGVAVQLDDLAPGDLIFSRGGQTGDVRDYGHVAVYVGGGEEIVAPHTGTTVQLRAVNRDAVQAVRRVVALPASGAASAPLAAAG